MKTGLRYCAHKKLMVKPMHTRNYHVNASAVASSDSIQTENNQYVPSTHKIDIFMGGNSMKTVFASLLKVGLL